MSVTKNDIAEIVKETITPILENMQHLHAGMVNLAENLDEQRVLRLKLELIERISAEEEPMRLELVKKVLDEDFDDDDDDEDVLDEIEDDEDDEDN
jgi:hypothetical protein